MTNEGNGMEEFNQTKERRRRRRSAEVEVKEDRLSVLAQSTLLRLRRDENRQFGLSRADLHRGATEIETNGKTMIAVREPTQRTHPENSLPAAAGSRRIHQDGAESILGEQRIVARHVRFRGGYHHPANVQEVLTAGKKT